MFSPLRSMQFLSTFPPAITFSIHKVHYQLRGLRGGEKTGVPGW